MFMVRRCVYLLREAHAKAFGYISQTLCALNDAGLPVTVIRTGDSIPFDASGVSVLEGDPASTIDELLKTDCAEEVLLLDDRLMGPLFPLDDLLRRADAADCDLWILSREAPCYGLRRNALRSSGLLKLLCSTEPIPPETVSDLRVAELYDTSALRNLTEHPLLDEPRRMAEELGCPFFLHEVFHRDYDEVIHATLGHMGQEFYRYLQTVWNTDLLWDYLLQACHQEDYYRNLHLTYVLPRSHSDAAWTAEHLKTHSLALVMHLYYEDLLEESCAYAQNFPPETDVYITTNSQEKKGKIEQIFRSIPAASLEVRVVENRGRDVSAYLIGARDVLERYDYVCLYHDKKTLQTKPGSVGIGFSYKCTENLFPTRDFVENVIRLFADNPRLGMLSPPPPHHAAYFFVISNPWSQNYHLTARLCKLLGFDVPISREKIPLAPLGTCFWCRGTAMAPLLRWPWSYEDFPPEPNNPDGTLLHAIERIYPFSAVEAGYYPAYLLSDRYAAIEHTTLKYYVQGYNRLCTEHGIQSYQREMCAQLFEKLQAK